ncbi:MAG: Hpt domain-containing protein [Chloroherpetonaceae bacterium]|nr:Hpt domain-containing protein [Chloroherpetonaceae bacterium]
MGYFGLGTLPVRGEKAVKKTATAQPYALANETLRLFISDIGERIRELRRYYNTQNNSIILEFLSKLSSSQNPVSDLELIDLSEFSDLLQFLRATRDKLQEEFVTESSPAVYQTLTENLESTAEYINEILSGVYQNSTALLRLDDYVSETLRKTEPVVEEADSFEIPALKPIEPIVTNFRPPEPFGFSLAELFENGTNGTYDDIPQPAVKAPVLKQPEILQAPTFHDLYVVIAETIDHICLKKNKSDIIAEVFRQGQKVGSAESLYQYLKQFQFIDGILDFIDFLHSNEGVSRASISRELTEQVSAHLISIFESVLDHSATKLQIESILFPQGVSLPDFTSLSETESALEVLSHTEPLKESVEALPTFDLDDLTFDLESNSTLSTEPSEQNYAQFAKAMLEQVASQLPSESAAAKSFVNTMLKASDVLTAIAESGIGEFSLFGDYLGESWLKKATLDQLEIRKSEWVTRLLRAVQQEFMAQTSEEIKILEPLSELHEPVELPPLDDLNLTESFEVDSVIEAFSHNTASLEEKADDLPLISLGDLTESLDVVDQSSNQIAEPLHTSLLNEPSQLQKESDENTSSLSSLPELTNIFEDDFEGKPLEETQSDTPSDNTSMLLTTDNIFLRDDVPPSPQAKAYSDLQYSAILKEAIRKSQSRIPRSQYGLKAIDYLQNLQEDDNLLNTLEEEPYRGTKALYELFITAKSKGQSPVSLAKPAEELGVMLSGELLAFYAKNEVADSELEETGFSIGDFIATPESDDNLPNLTDESDEMVVETAPIAIQPPQSNHLDFDDYDDDILTVKKMPSKGTVSEPEESLSTEKPNPDDERLHQSPESETISELSQANDELFGIDDNFILDDSSLTLSDSALDQPSESKSKDPLSSLLSKATPEQSDQNLGVDSLGADLLLPEDDVFTLSTPEENLLAKDSNQESESSLQNEWEQQNSLPAFDLTYELSETPSLSFAEKDELSFETTEVLEESPLESMPEIQDEMLEDLPLLSTETQLTNDAFADSLLSNEDMLFDDIAEQAPLSQEQTDTKQRNELKSISKLSDKSTESNAEDLAMGEDLVLDFDEGFLLKETDDELLGNPEIETASEKESPKQEEILSGLDPVSDLLPETELSFDTNEPDLNFTTTELEQETAPVQNNGLDFSTLNADIQLSDLSDENIELNAIKDAILSSLNPQPEKRERNTNFVPDEIQQIFLEEAKEYLEKLNEDLLALDKVAETVQTDLVHRIMRGSHTLKGSAAMVGLKNIATLGHKMEDCLQVVRDGNLPAQKVLLDALFQATDALTFMVNEFKETGKDDFDHLDEITQVLAGYTQELQKSGKISVATSAQKEVAQAPAKKFVPDEIQQIFLDEAKEYLEKLSQDVLELDKLIGTEQPELVNRVLRSSHTLKGSAAMVGLKNISELGHHMEDCLQVMRDRNLKVSREVIDLLLPCSDMIATLLKDFRETGGDSGGKQAPFVKALGNYTEQLKTVGKITTPINITELKKSGSETLQSQGQEAEGGQGKRPAIAAEQTVRIDIKSLNSLVNLSAELVISRNRLNNELHTLQKFINRVIKDRTQLTQVAKKVNTMIQKSNESKELEKAQAFSSEVLREFSDTEFDRFSDMDIINRDLKSTMLNLDDSISDLRDITSTFNQNIAKVTTLANDFNREVVTMRMVPVKQMFTRFNRSVRDIAKTEGKELNFTTEGEETKLDKNVMEEVIEPVMHIVRNAIGHGIETPEVRLDNGKDPMGNLSMRAYQKGSRFILEIEDDGGGIKVAKVKAKALKQGIITQEEADRMSTAEASALIFKAGFSTADKITELQGRGVGLDVVANTIRKLKGSVHIDSVEGKGTKFMISLPLTLAIGQALLVGAMNLTYAIPLEIVTETAFVLTETVETDEDGKKWINLRGDQIELRYLNAILGDSSDAMQFKAKVAVVVVEIEDVGKFAIAVEKLGNKEEIVVKSLGKHLRNVKGVIGSTILGDGQVVIILDMEYLLKSEAARADVGVSVETAPVEVEPDTPQVVRKKRKGERILVLHADDSPSVRKYASSVLTQAGIDVVSCDDGLNALTRLPKTPADIIITDLEMPRMNGFELVSEIRKMPEYKDIPIIIVSARAGDKHRRTGLELGANSFLNKPFDPQQLIETIENYIA